MAGEIDWSLARPTPDLVTGGINAFLLGQKLGQAVQTQRAFQGYAADPAGALNALVAAGNVPAAAQLSQLGYQQQQRALLADVGDRLRNRVQQQVQPPQPAMQPPIATDQQRQQILGVLDYFDGAAKSLRQLPYEDRRAALAQIAPDLVAHGVPQDRLAAFDPSDENLDAVDQQAARAHQILGTQPGQSAMQSAAPSPADAAAAPTLSVPPPAAVPANVGAPGTAAFLNPRDPNDAALLGELTLANPQMGSGLLEVAKAGMPQISSGRPGGVLYDQNTGQIIGAAPNAEGIQLEAQNGRIVAAHEVPGYREAQAGNAGAIAGAKEGAQQQAQAAHRIVEVTINGVVHQMLQSDLEALRRSGVLGQLGIGVGLSPGAEQFQKDDASAFSKEVEAHGPSAIMSSQNARTVTEQALHLAQVINPNAWTANLGKVASVVNAATGGKIGAKEANDVATYTGLLPQVARGTFTTFPRLEKEFEIVLKGTAGVNTPQDAAKMLLATQAAVQGRNLAYAQWLANDYQGPPSKKAMNTAFANSPVGRQSLFADPVWRNLTIAGKPAVLIGDHPLQDGHVYGVFRPGTPYAQTFMVQ